MSQAGLLMRVARPSPATARGQEVALTESQFNALADATPLFRESECGQLITKADVLALCASAPASAYRLYMACRCAFAPATVLCRDLFEMPARRKFPELAAAFEAAPMAESHP